MNDSELQKRWNLVRQKLESARGYLPERPIENSGGHSDRDLGTLDAFQEHLDHNEFELALDQIEALGTLNRCSADFWRILEKAAQSMHLNSRSARLRRRLGEAIDHDE